jgi:hypothetical protein
MIIDPDAPLALPIATKFFEAISRRLGEFLYLIHTFDLPEFAEGNALNRCESAAVKSLENPLRFSVSERSDHALIVPRLTLNVKRLTGPLQCQSTCVSTRSTRQRASGSMMRMRVTKRVACSSLSKTTRLVTSPPRTCSHRQTVFVIGVLVCKG